MNKRFLRKSLIFIFSFFLCSTFVFAAEPVADVPLASLLTPLVRFLNVIILSGGAIFIIMIAVSAYKFAMAQGDPRAMQGAKDALTYTIIGGLVVGGLLTIYSITVSLFGLESEGFGDANVIVNIFRDNLQNIQDIATR